MNMNHFKLIFCWLSIFACCFSMSATAQVTPVRAATDTSQKVQILNYTRQLTFTTIDTTRLTIIAGDVTLRQGKTLFYCDSCVINNNTNVFEAWGRQVHINDSDTANIYSNHLRYLMNRKLAYLDGNVKLTDGKGVLTTPDLEYDMETNIGIYKNGGKVENGKTILTSREGWYYADLKDVYFKKDVVLNDPAYKITTDSLLYNTFSKTTRFISQTKIVDSSGVTITTRDGYYNQQTGEAEFGQRPTIIDHGTKVTANSISKSDSIYKAEGNAVIIDSVNNTILMGGLIFQDKRTDAMLATKRPLMIIIQDSDSTYVRADTLFSAKLSDRFGDDSIHKDTLKGTRTISANSKDSTNRYFEAYRNVRIFNDSLQAVCDSMFYSAKDSIFRLFQNPVVWTQDNQLTGDTILLYTKNKKPDKVQAFENGFMINKLDPEAFNQIKSTRIDGWFVDGNIDSVRAKGFAECIYYIQDEDSAYTGVNESRSDMMDIYFENKQLDRVVFRNAVTGTIWPLSQKKPQELLLPNFQWHEDRRPKTKYEMFE